jgi:hypothetical protein
MPSVLGRPNFVITRANYFWVIMFMMFMLLINKDYVTPSVLRPKQTTKSCHGHHVYVIMHVVKCVYKFLLT